MTTAANLSGVGDISEIQNPKLRVRYALHQNVKE